MAEYDQSDWLAESVEMKRNKLQKSRKTPARGSGHVPASESWQVQTAKARFSEVFRRARTEGPQPITRQGKEGVVMLAEEQYVRLTGKSHQPRNLVEFFCQSRLVGAELDLERDCDEGRTLKL